MKTRLLKKLRKDAHKKFGIELISTPFGDEFYRVALRSGLEIGVGASFNKLKDAERELDAIRRSYIIHKVQQLRDKERNKKLAKI